MKYRILHVSSNNTYQIEKKVGLLNKWEFVVGYYTLDEAKKYISRFYKKEVLVLEV